MVSFELGEELRKIIFRLVTSVLMGTQNFFYVPRSSQDEKTSFLISCNVRLSTDLNHGDPSQLKFSSLLLDIIILFVSLIFPL